MGAVVAPATIAPALQGWLLDSQSWTWIFFSVVPVALAAPACCCSRTAPRQLTTRAPAVRLDRPRADLGCAALLRPMCSSQGSRWDWFERAAHRLAEPDRRGGPAGISRPAGNGRAEPALLDFSLFRSADFSFAFIVSFVAGAALFGSAFLIPSFAVSVLASRRPTPACCCCRAARCSSARCSSRPF